MPTMPGSILDIFKNLSSGSLQSSGVAAEEIFKNIPDFKNGNDEVTSECKYILTRLMRGMASPDLKTKTGFFSLLVTLLRLHKGITYNLVDEILESKLEIGNHDSSRERSDVISAQILVYGAIFRSGLYKKCTEKEQRSLLESLLVLSKKKSYFLPLSFSFFLGLLSEADSDLFESLLWPLLKPTADEEISKHCIESLSCLLLSRKKFLNETSDLDLSTFLNAETLPAIARKTAGVPSSELQSRFLNLLAESICQMDDTNESLTVLWNDGFEKGMKSYFGGSDAPFLFVSNVLEGLEDHSLVCIFLTTNFVKALIKDDASAAGKKCLTTLTNYFKNHLMQMKEKTVFKSLELLTTDPKNPFVENKIGVQFFQSLISSLKDKHVKKLAKSYDNILQGSTERNINGRSLKISWSAKARLNAASILLKLINVKSCHSDCSWQAEQFQLILSAALSKTIGKSMDDKLRDDLKHLFYSAISKPVSLKEHYKILVTLANFVDNAIKAENFQTPLSKEEKAVWNSVTAKSKSIEKKIKKSNSDNLVDIVFLSLYLQMGLQLFSQSSLASEAIQKLNEYHEMSKSKSLAENEILDATVSLLLDLLSLESVLVRQVVTKTFASISSQLKPDTLVRILKILDPDEDNTLDEESSLSESDGEESEDGEKEAKEEKDKDSDESDISDDNALSEDDGPNNETETDRLRQAMNAALGNNANYTDTESIDLDDLDDETGDLLDARLGQVFKLFKKPPKKKKKVQSPDDKAVTHYRIRILDLIETIIDGNPSLFAAVNILNTLVMLFESCKSDKFQEPLRKRVAVCLKKIVSLKKFSDFNDVDEPYLASTLEALLERHNLLPNPGEYYCFIIRASQQLSKSSSHSKTDEAFSIVDVLKRALKDFFSKKNSFYKMDMFLPILNLQWDGLLQLVPFIASYAYQKSGDQVLKQNAGVKMIDKFYLNNRLASQIPRSSICVDQKKKKNKKKK